MPGQYPDQFPPFGSGMRSTFDYFHTVIFLRLTVLVVCVADRPLPYVFLIKRVPGPALDFHAQCLRRLGAGHDADQFPLQCSTLCFCPAPTSARLDGQKSLTTRMI